MSESTAVEQPATLTEELTAAFDSYEETHEDADSGVDAEVEIEAAETDEAVIDEEAEVVTEETTEEPAGIEPPEHWSDTDKEMFVNQSPEAQEWLLNRHKAMEGDYTRKMQEFAPLKEYEAVQQLFDPYMDQLRQAGSSPAQEIQRWAQVDRALASDPVNTINWLASQYGISFGEQGAEQAEVNPEIQSLKSELDGLRSQLTQREQQEYQTRHNTLSQEIQAFSEEKTEAGELAHPYFEEVMSEMMTLAQTEASQGKQPKLSDLYDRAVWMNTSVREKHLASQRKAEEAKRQEEARQKAAKAKKASKPVTGSPSGSSPDADLSLRDQIASQF